MLTLFPKPPAHVTRDIEKHAQRMRKARQPKPVKQHQKTKPKNNAKGSVKRNTKQNKMMHRSMNNNTLLMGSPVRNFTPYHGSTDMCGISIEKVRDYRSYQY